MFLFVEDYASIFPGQQVTQNSLFVAMQNLVAETVEKSGLKLNVQLTHPEFFRLYDVQENDMKAETWAECNGSTPGEKRAHHAERHYTGKCETFMANGSNEW
jgi:ribosomal protein S27AE